MAKNGKKRPAAAGGEKPKACYVLSLSVENVRCFGPKQTLDLSDGNGRPAQWTIILGENGTGKTTLLQALAGHDGRWLNNRELRDTASRRANGRRCTSMLEMEYIPAGQPESHEPPEPISASVSLNPGVGLFTAITEPGGLPFIAYGASRRLGRPRLSEEEPDDAVGSLFSDVASLRNVIDWLILLDYGASRSNGNHKQHQRRLAQVTTLLTSGVLPGVRDIRFKIKGDAYPTAMVEFETPYGWVPIRQLGYGYQTAIAWMLDFVSRMFERYPDSPDPLKEPAVCVVDEIDLHLHPKWQRELIGLLSAQFPKTQFIATAHSPLVVQAAENANIAVVRKVEGKDYVEILNDMEDIRNWRVDQILTSDLFGLESARSPRVERILKRQEQLAGKARLTLAEKKELKELQDQIDHLPVGRSAAENEELAAIRQALDALRATSPK